MESIIELSAVEIVGDTSLKYYAKDGDPKWFLVGSAAYTAIVALLVRSFKTNTVLYINAGWDGLSALMESVWAYYYLGERFERPTQYVGAALIVTGLFLLK